MSGNVLGTQGSRPDRRPRALLLILIVLFLLRWWLATLPGYPSDLNTYKRWALTGTLNGVHTIYDDRQTTFDYPPLYAYFLTPMGKLYHLIAPEAAEGWADSPTFSILIKLPPQAFDILIALCLAMLVARFGMWGRRPSWVGWLPALIYLFHPAVLCDSAYWGQPDAIHTALVMIGLTLILLGKSEFGWIAASLACLMKPLALPFLPLLAVATLIRSGWLRTITGGCTALATGIAVFLPFILTGRGTLAVDRIVTDSQLMPFTSVNSHNIWWLLGPWRNADAPWIGPLTPTVAGQILFGFAYLAVLLLTARVEWRRHGRVPIGVGPRPLTEQTHWYIAMAAVAFSFFMLSTHLHENHLFAAIPFLILLAGLSRLWAWLCALVGFSILVNMVNHDLILAHEVWMKIGGESTFFHIDFNRPLSWLELIVATANSVLMVLLYVAFLALGWSWLRRTAPSNARR